MREGMGRITAISEDFLEVTFRKDSGLSIHIQRYTKDGIRINGWNPTLFYGISGYQERPLDR